MSNEKEEGQRRRGRQRWRHAHKSTENERGQDEMYDIYKKKVREMSEGSSPLALALSAVLMCVYNVV